MAKVIRDPLYGDIKLNYLEAALVDHVAFQRLRRITQLAGAPFVYPSAVHTRFSHSLGTMYVAKRYAEALELNASDALITSLCALLHDLGHGPFSHCFEDAVRGKPYCFNHEKMGIRLIRTMERDVLDYCSDKIISGLEEEARQYGFQNVEAYIHWALDETANAMVDDDYRNRIVDGPMGADRLDFIARDAYFTGVSAFNTVDIFRLTGNAMLIDGKLVFRSKVVDNIYGLSVGRFLMYKNVYYHKTSRAAELMMQLMMREALKEGLIEDYMDDDNFVFFDEPSLIGLLQSKGKKSKEMWDKLIRRKLWKVVREMVVKPDDLNNVLGDLKAHFDAQYIDVPEKLNLANAGDYDDILVLTDEGIVKTLIDFEKETGYSLLQEESSLFVRVYKEV